MKQSFLFTKTQKENPKDEESVNAILLQRAGFIYKEMSGVYSFLPMGLIVLNKIANIVREEMVAIGGQEILMSVLQPKALWQKTNRWDKGIGKNVMYKVKDGLEVGLGPTHEEMLTDIIKNHIASINDLPLAVFQIQTKFRKEPRAKAGLLRGREFLMKDLYSFHSSIDDFKNYYEKAKKAYTNVFERCGLKAILTEASGGDFSKEFSHEFQVISSAGEDTIYYCPNELALSLSKGHFSQNEEIFNKKIKKCPVCGQAITKTKTIEAGNIFTLGTKYSEALGAFFTDKNGRKSPVIMGCYGLGISRLMGAVVEVWHDEKGILWPQNVAPFDYHLLPILSGKQEGDKLILKKAQDLYNDLRAKGAEVLYDDRLEKSPGEKFSDADLIGIPKRLVISERTVQEDQVEVKERIHQKAQLVKISELEF